jgi:uncharacterized protein (DUF1778 family)
MKTKVVAFRVTQEEYDALAFVAKSKGVKLSYFVDEALLPTIQQAIVEMNKEQKRLQARVKRQAKKGSIADGLQ